MSNSKKIYKRNWRMAQTIEDQILESSSSDSESQSNLADDTFSNGHNVSLQIPIPGTQLESEDCPQSQSSSSFESSLNDSDSESEDIDLERSGENDEMMDALIPEVDSLHEDLAHWAAFNNITRTATNSLLSVLIKHGIDSVPKDARTLLKTRSTVHVLQKCGGDYFYRGIEKSLQCLLMSGVQITGDTFQLQINIDGCPLFKSSNSSLWPIAGKISNERYQFPFLIALYFGKGKPSNVHEFLKDFLEEYAILRDNGFDYEGSHYQVHIEAILCDAPARQYLKCIKARNAYYGCERCIVEGQSIEKRMVFFEFNCEKRTADMFNSISYSDHQIQGSPFIASGVNCIEEFPLDYMHLILLGVVKRLFSYLNNGPRICKISQHHISLISEKLKLLAGNFPVEFARQPRGIDEMSRWKSTEFRQFLIYSSPVVLSDILRKDYYVHFLTLSVATRILLDDDVVFRNNYIGYASDLMEYFVRKSRILYGPTFCVYNVHSLLHIM